MYKVMLVDDEAYMLKGLKNIISWEEYGLEIVAETTNSLKAIELALSLSVDIVLTDIKMPRMNGLELISHLKKQQPSIKFIVLSGYDDFEYVKGALKLGIENYLLKPINEEELSQTLLNITKTLDAEREANIKALETSSILKSNILNRWITHMISPVELYDRAQILGLNLDCEYYLLCILYILEDDKYRVYKDPNKLRYTLIESCNQILSFTIGHEIFYNFNGNILLYFYGDATSMTLEAIKVLLETCVTHIVNTFNINVFLSIGSLENHFQDLPKSYENANNLMSYKLIVPPNSMINAEDALEIIHPKEKMHETHPLVKRTKDYIAANLHQELSLKSLAAIFHVNPSYLGQLFKNETGELFTNYLNKCRIEKAMTLLVNSDSNANDIARRVGYTNTNYFYTCFKKFTGKYPTEYRRELH